MLIDEIVTRITPVFSELRKMDGTRYKGNILKAVNGALSSTGIFLRLDVLMRVGCELQNLKWMIREEELEIYEERAQKKLKAKGKRKRERESSGVIAVERVGASGGKAGEAKVREATRQEAGDHHDAVQHKRHAAFAEHRAKHDLFTEPIRSGVNVTRLGVECHGIGRCGWTTEEAWRAGSRCACNYTHISKTCLRWRRAM